MDEPGKADRSKGHFGRAGAFLFRFFLISGCMFLLWFEVQGWYVRFLDWFVIHGFILFGYRLVIPHDTAVYYETFNMVTFTSLILSIRSDEWAKKAKALAAGLGLFFLLHLFHRIDIALISAFHVTSLMTTDIFLCDVGQYLLPVLLLLGSCRAGVSREQIPVSLPPTRLPQGLKPPETPCLTLRIYLHFLQDLYMALTEL